METVSGNLVSALRIEPGITAIIGSGGKSTLLKTLGLELMRAGGRALLCTTTHMFPVAGVPWDGSSRRLDAVPWKPGASHAPVAPARHARDLRAEASAEQASWTQRQASSPPLPSRSTSWRSTLTMYWPRQMAAKRLPLKAHAATGAGNSRHHGKRCLGRRRLGAGQTHQRGRPPPQALLRALRLQAHRHRHARARRPVLNAEMQALKLRTARVMLNQVDTLSDPTMADRFEAALGRPIVATSLKVAGPFSLPVAVKYGLFGRLTAANSPYFTATAEGVRRSPVSGARSGRVGLRWARRRCRQHAVHKHGLGAAMCLKTLERRVVHSLMLRRRANGPARLGIPHAHVGIGALGKTALARIHAKDARRVLAHQAAQILGSQLALKARGNRDGTMLNAGPAVGNRAEIVAPAVLFARAG